MLGTYELQMVGYNGKFEYVKLNDKVAGDGAGKTHKGHTPAVGDHRVVMQYYFGKRYWELYRETPKSASGGGGAYGGSSNYNSYETLLFSYGVPFELPRWGWTTSSWIEEDKRYTYVEDEYIEILSVSEGEPA